MGMWLVNYGGQSLTGLNTILWTREIPTHELCLSKWGKTYLKSDYNFPLIIKKGNTLGRILVYSAPGSASWGTVSPCPESLKIWRFHTQDLILGRNLQGDVMEVSVPVSIWDREGFSPFWVVSLVIEENWKVFTLPFQCKSSFSFCPSV